MNNESTITRKNVNSRLAVFLKANLLLFIVTIVTVILSKIMVLAINDTCTFKQKTGIPCPFCGGTRCAVNIMRLDFIEAFKYHPSTAILLIYIIFIDIMYLIDIIRGNNKNKIIYRIDLIAYAYLILSAIVYIIRLVLIFNHVDCDYIYLNL